MATSLSPCSKEGWNATQGGETESSPTEEALGARDAFCAVDAVGEKRGKRLVLVIKGSRSCAVGEEKKKS